MSLDRTGPLGGGLSAKYTASRRVSLTADWYTDAYWVVDAYVSFSGEALSDLFQDDGVLDRGEQRTRQPLSVRDHRERCLAGRAPDDFNPRLRDTRPIRAPVIHNRRLRVSTFSGEYQTTVWTLRPLRIRVACIISYSALNVILAPQLQTHREDNHGNETYGSQPGPYA